MIKSQLSQPATATRRSIWVQRRIDLVYPQVFLLMICAVGLAIVERSMLITESEQIAFRTLWLCWGVAIGAMLLLDNFVKSSLFIDGTAAVMAITLAYSGLLLALAFTHAFYTRSAFAVFVSTHFAVQLWLCLRVGKRRAVVFLANDEHADSLLLNAVTHRSAAMQQLNITVLKREPLSAEFENVDGLVISGPPETGSAAERDLIAARLLGLRVYSAGFIYELISGRVSLQSLHASFLDDAARHPIYRVTKRLLDVVGALVVSILTLPIVVLAAAAIKLDSHGPVLFSQSRYGRGGKLFTIHKLRTMALVHEAHGKATADNDQRITRIGVWLRRYRIDELPQLWNVLLGDMSLIGPRPEWEITAHELVAHIPQFDMRLLLRPGITGWAQVHQGHVTSHDDVRTKLEFDLFYIRHMSLLLDLTIGWRTLKTIATSAGAK
jgi:lipopolysaccharide/colanic/teichoic acid biosynthesis glycosyltransferase